MVGKRRVRSKEKEFVDLVMEEEEEIVKEEQEENIIETIKKMSK